MARRPIVAKRKPKAVRITKSEQYLVNKKYLGDEPVLKGCLSGVEYSKAMNWYNAMITSAEAKDYIVEYLIKLGKPDAAKKIKSLNDNDVPLTVAWTFRLMSRGAEIESQSVRYVMGLLKNVLDKIEDVVTDDEPRNVISIQDRMRERTHDILGEIEGLVDDEIEKDSESEAFSLYAWLQEHSIPVAYVSAIKQKFAPVLDELIEAFEGKDAQLKEAYGYLSKKELKSRIVFFNNMIDDADRYANNTKKVRKPRKPRTISVEKKLKSFKFQKEDAQFKIASVGAEKIIGAQELWTFNTKYRTLTVFRARDRGGLQVKGTTIINYDEATSKTKGTGRRTEDYIKRVLEGGKIVLRKLIDELKTDKPLATRTNESTILLRVVQ